jgi:DNA-binding transcriptional ArsR family regulator
MKQKQTITDHQNIMASMLKAMAHPERLAIMNLMCMEKKDRLTVKCIYERLGLQQPIVSRHLNILKHAGVIKRQQEGQKVYYSLCFEKKMMNTLFKSLV